ncbi:hypothetical protein LCGC14_1916140 [marine sediment metagenome]|uniref:Uncharacterized protein n=1 Tax=marine sediment metagenome TaxID=412755 RepID=A0A0F9GFJ8_9ZZZZ
MNKKSARQKRVENHAKKMMAGLKAEGACQDLDPDFLNAWMLLFANELEWTLEQMKGPGIMHQLFPKGED